MTYNNILINIHEHVLTITVNRPDKLNALNAQTIQEIGDAVKRAEDNKEIYGIIITGTGSKALLRALIFRNSQTILSKKEKHWALRDKKVLSRSNCAASQSLLQSMASPWEADELAMSCHIRVASDNAKFGQPEVKLGLFRICRNTETCSVDRKR